MEEYITGKGIKCEKEGSIWIREEDKIVDYWAVRVEISRGIGTPFVICEDKGRTALTKSVFFLA